MESVDLDSRQQKMYNEIKDGFEEVKKRIYEDKEVKEEQKSNHAIIQHIGGLAHELHNSLKQSGMEPRHHDYMVENRGHPPEHPSFYKHYHPIEDLIAFIENPKANDDPKDKTLGDDFTFEVYSKRWGHKDTYKLTRTKFGWEVKYLAINGPTDKGGQSALFDNLSQDSIAYPNGLSGWIEWLWEEAADQGLSHVEVQRYLNDLAKWVQTTERQKPSGDIWEGYA